MLTLIFETRASEPPSGPGERLKRPDLIGLRKTSRTSYTISETIQSIPLEVAS